MYVFVYVFILFHTRLEWIYTLWLPDSLLKTDAVSET